MLAGEHAPIMSLVRTSTLGAMFVYVGTESEAVCRELGIETIPVSPASFGVSIGGETVVARDDEE
ncbi:hypothetical protein MPLDJ20_20215 [Mesorhizobium plurifarium]|uniref:Uncharacterized protein n=1 Tax=Mesorhizobium plurifarium TaxID=69974 RepID=A0A090EV32_MESPL|nr:hypothetical protein MPLSOD_150112 [Mesorhizobium sp. SOD10]CDX35484.1 hypothetical protein MPLDJ20_20215 [Mesorhizobium plurifarium]